ncbi:hypothetical protein [Lysobacter sp. A3-1-A15]|uniref:hypothetical protein n=1 Tax=Novilysobacter viscosus TaxID=3098602 RepID=UPI002ED7BD48
MSLPKLFSWRIVLLFGAAAPPMGALVWLTFVPRVSGELSFGEFATDALLLLVVALPFSWVLGLAPSLAAGLLMSAACALAPDAVAGRRVVRALLGAALGYIATLAYKWGIFGPADLGAGLPLEMIGALAAAACSLLVRPEWVRPHDSARLKTLRRSP